MKRWFVFMLALAILLSPTQSAVRSARAEEDAPLVSEQVENAAEVAGEFDLLEFDDGEEEAPQESDPQGTATEATARYVSLPKGAEIAASPAGEAFLMLSEEGTALVLSASDGYLNVAFNSEGMVVTGFAAEDAATELDAEAVNAYLDACAQSGECVFYDGDPDRPLESIECVPVEVLELHDAEAEILETAGDAAVAKEPTSIAFETGSLNIGYKETFAGLRPVMQPAGATTTLTWTTSNSKYVKVDAATGAIYGAKTGSATITATTKGGKTASYKVTVKKAPTKVELQLSAGSISVGDRAQSRITVNHACNTFTFESSNPRVATVNGSGVVTGVGAGTATITVRTYNGEKDSASITVFAPPAKVVFPDKTLSVGINQTLTLAPEALNADGSKASATMTFAIVSQSPSGVISLDAKTGKLTANKMGSAVISATTHNGVSATCNVTVIAAPKSVTLNASTGSVGLKETYTGLRATLVMSDGSKVTDGGVTWSSSKPKVASVDENTGAITGLKTGSATITARTYNGLTAQCKVTVVKAPSSITVSPSSLRLSAGGMTSQLTIQLPKKTACSTFRFSSNNTAVAKVSANGVVTSVGEGKATIMVQSYNGETDYCNVEVYGQPAQVAFQKTSVMLGERQTATLKATVTSASGGETQTNLTYYIDSSSPNPKCISLNASTGEVTAVSAGTAYVGVRTHNGESAKTLCAVTVAAAPVAVIMPGTYTIGVGGVSSPIPVQVRYSNGQVADAENLTWSTSKAKYVAVNTSTGELKGVKKGSATITVKTYNGLTASCKVEVVTAPTVVKMSPATLKLAAGGMKFALQITTDTGATGAVTMTSSNPNVARVDQNGVITTVNKGTATIYAQTYNNKTAACALTVTGVPTKASFASSSVTLSPSQSVTPQVSVTSADGAAAVANLTFKIVSGSDVIRLDTATGEITALKTGTSVVSVQTHNGVVSSNSFTVVVKGAGGTTPTAPTSFSILNETSVTLGVGMKHTIAVGAASGNVTWSSSKAKVASVDKYGNVTAVATGSATITGKDAKGATVTCSVTVKKAPSSVSISPSSGTLYRGTMGKYTVKLSSGSVGTYTLASSDTSVATVTDDGYVTAHKVGAATITVTTHNGRVASSKLTVKDPGTPNVPSEIEKLGVASYTNNYTSNMTNAQKIEYVIYMGQSQLGMPYKHGSGYKTTNPSGFDCSGLVYWCYYKIGIKLSDSAKGQGYDNKYTKITSISDLKRGDVVIFNTSDDSDLSDHTGIYLGKGYFLHASSAGGKVMISDLASGYYNRNFSWARRILE